MRQVLTRAQQLAAKKAAKEKDNDKTNRAAGDEGDDESEDTKPVMKRPSRRTKGNDAAKDKAEKPKQKGKAKAKAKGKAKASTRRKSKKQNAKESEVAQDEVQDEDHEGEEEETVPGKRQLFLDDEEVDPDDHVPTQDAVAEEPQQKKKKAATKKRKSKSKSKPAPADDGQPVPAAKRRRPAAKPDAAVETPAPKAKARGSRKKAPQVAGVEALMDDAMKGIVMQTLKNVKSMTAEHLKEYLKDKKGDLTMEKSHMNTDWTKASSGVRLKAKGNPQITTFSFKTGSWNTRMASAFMASYLMVPRHSLTQYVSIFRGSCFLAWVCSKGSQTFQYSNAIPITYHCWICL